MSNAEKVRHMKSKALACLLILSILSLVYLPFIVPFGFGERRGRTTSESFLEIVRTDPLSEIDLGASFCSPESNKGNNERRESFTVGSSGSGSTHITVEYPTGTGVTPETLILYDSSWKEITRASPSSNTHTFYNLSPGTYHIEAYADDMFIGSSENIPVSGGQSTHRTITTFYKRTLTVTVYYSDGSHRQKGATIKVYSWDGYHGRYNFRYQETSDSNGQASFNLWPTSVSGEHYKFKVYFDGQKVGEKSNVKVDKNSGGTCSVTTSVSYMGSIQITVKYPTGSGVTPETLILYDQNWNELKRASPSSNVYTFSDLSPGTFHVEAYVDDMFVGDAENIPVQAGQTTKKAITSFYKEDLTVNIYYSDGSTSFPSATVKVYSWDGYHQIYDYRYEKTTDSNGKAVFTLWPTTIFGEHYKLKVYYNSQKVGEKSSVNVPGSVPITTSVNPPPTKGSIKTTVKYYDGSALTSETLILYDQNWNELKRASPASNVYTFTDLSPGTYHVEAYVDDMFVGSAENIPVSAGQAIDETIQTQWPKRTLTATVYYRDSSTVFPSATVKVYSWDGYHLRWNYRYQGTTNSNGQVSFLLWPTMITNEKYKVEIIYNSQVVGTQEPVYIDKNTGANIKITTTIDPPKGGIEITTKDYYGTLLSVEWLCLYDSGWDLLPGGKEKNPSNPFTFSDISPGTYHVEAYVDDMFIGSAEDIPVYSGQATAVTLYAFWTEKTLKATVYYSDGSTRFPDVTVKVYSWDSTDSQWHYRYQSDADGGGECDFTVWPTTESDEKYKVEVYDGSSKVGWADPVYVDKNTGGTESITTEVDPPPPPKGAIEVTTKDYYGALLSVEWLILYDSGWNPLSKIYDPSNPYTFGDLSLGVYHVEAYVDDMFIGSDENIVVDTDDVNYETLYAFWTEKTLGVTVYYSDGSTVFPGATVKVYSWDSYNEWYNYRYEDVTDSNGEYEFSLWPTTMPAEEWYGVEVFYDSGPVVWVTPVHVNKGTDGEIDITTTVSPPVGNIEVTVTYPTGDTVVPDVYVLYNNSWREVDRENPGTSTCTFSNLHPSIYHVEVYKDDMMIGSATNVEVKSEITTQAPIETYHAGNLEIIINCSDENTPLPNAEVAVRSHEGNLVRSGTTDESGIVFFDHLWSTTISGEYYYVHIYYGEHGTVGGLSRVYIQEQQTTSEDVSTTVNPIGSISIRVEYPDRSPVTPSVCILYNDSNHEIERLSPGTNTFTLSDLKVGKYHVEVYADGMWIGSATDITVDIDRTTEKTITTLYKQVLTVTAFLGNGIDPLPDATVKIYSWDGHHLVEHYVAEGRTSVGGKLSLLLWPTSKNGEHYLVYFYYGGNQVGLDTNVQVPSDIEINTNLQRSAEITYITTDKPSYSAVAEITLDIRIKNSGDFDLSGLEITITMVNSNNEVAREGVFKDMISLNVGEERTFSDLYWTVPSDFNAGTYTITALLLSDVTYDQKQITVKIEIYSYEIANVISPSSGALSQEFYISAIVSYYFTRSTDVRFSVWNNGQIANVDDTLMGNGYEVYNFKLTAPDSTGTSIIQLKALYFKDGEWKQDVLGQFDVQIIIVEGDVATESFRVTGLYFNVEYDGMIYKAFLTENLRISSIPSSFENMDEFFRWKYSKFNWYVVDLGGNLITDVELYTKISFAAEIALLGITLWNPNNLQASADQYYEISKWSLWLWICQKIGDLSADLLGKTIKVVVPIPDADGIKWFTKLLVTCTKQVVDPDNLVTIASVEMLKTGAQSLLEASSTMSPIYNEALHYQRIPAGITVDYEDMTSFYAKVVKGRTMGYVSMRILSKMYKDGIWRYLRSVAGSLIGEVDPTSAVALYLLIDAAEESSEFRDFIEDELTRQDRFYKTMYEVFMEGAKAFAEDFAEEQSTVTVIEGQTPEGIEVNLLVSTNSTVLSSDMSGTEKSVTISVGGPEDSEGYLSISIPKSLLASSNSDANRVLITVDGEIIPFTVEELTETYVLHVNYPQSQHDIRIYYMTYSVSITVLDFIGRPLPNAEIKIVGPISQEYFTDDEGIAIFLKVPEGPYILETFYGNTVIEQNISVPDQTMLVVKTDVHRSLHVFGVIIIVVSIVTISALCIRKRRKPSRFEEDEVKTSNTLASFKRDSFRKTKKRKI